LKKRKGEKVLGMDTEDYLTSCGPVEKAAEDATERTILRHQGKGKNNSKAYPQFREQRSNHQKSLEANGKKKKMEHSEGGGQLLKQKLGRRQKGGGRRRVERQ